MEPFRTIGDVADLFGIDGFQRRDRVGIAGISEQVDHARGDVEPACLQHHRHDRQTAHEILRRLLRRAPHAVMGRQLAIIRSHSLQPVAEQVEMLALFVRRAHPVVEIALGHRNMGKAGDDVPVQINGVQFDMRDGMDQGDAAPKAAGFPARNLVGRQQFRRIRPRRAVGRGRVADLQRVAILDGGEPQRGCGVGFRGLFVAVGGGQDLDRQLRQCGAAHRACAAARTSSTWPGTLTLRQT